MPIVHDMRRTAIGIPSMGMSKADVDAEDAGNNDTHYY